VVSPVIFWFRRDLRLSDNRALVAAIRTGDGNLMPVFVIDPELAGVVPPPCAQPGALEGLLTPPGYVAPMVAAAVERSDAPARCHEARNRARRSSMDEGVA
jgi:hypothetical protein